MSYSTVNNLSAQANAILSGHADIIFVGDSISTLDTNNRLMLGLRNNLPGRFYSFTSMGTPTTADVLAGVHSTPFQTSADSVAQARVAGTSTPFQGSGATILTYTPGSVAISSRAWAERQMSRVAALTSPVYRVFMDGTLFSSFAGGNWNNDTSSWDFYYYYDGGATSVASFDLIPYRAGSQVGGGITVNCSGGAGWKKATVTCNGTGEPWIQIFSTVGIGSAYAGHGANSSLAMGGARYYDPNVRTGLSLTSFANAGWTASAHIDTAIMSDANLNGFINNLGLGQYGRPTVVIFLLGQNLLAGTEKDGSDNLLSGFSTNMQTLITRYKTAVNAAGAKFYGVVLGVYDTQISSYPYIVDEQTALYNLSLSNSDVGFGSLLNVCGTSASLVAAGYTGSGGDTVHPSNAAGANFFGKKVVDLLRMGANTPRNPRGTPHSRKR